MTRRPKQPKPDSDKPIQRQPEVAGLPCAACTQPCCRVAAHGWPASPVGPWEDGKCPNLTAEGRCAIYATRPQACRAFDCSKRPEFLAAHPEVPHAS